MQLRPIDTLWVLFCTLLVFLMQPGFLCLESGLTRSKNSINVAAKNLTDLGVAVLLFWAVGFALMFGSTAGGIVGLTGWFEQFSGSSESLAAFFLFQAAFCATASTILSGAVAERMTFGGFMLVTALSSALIYPIFGHWVWNGALSGTTTGWLRAGFHRLRRLDGGS